MQIHHRHTLKLPSMPNGWGFFSQRQHIKKMLPVFFRTEAPQNLSLNTL